MNIHEICIDIGTYLSLYANYFSSSGRRLARPYKMRVERVEGVISISKWGKGNVSGIKQMR